MACFRVLPLALPLLLAGCHAHPDTALTAAAAEGRTTDALALIGQGADPNLTDGSGFTPLVWAARNGHGTTVEGLLAAGCDPDRPVGSNDWAPLVHAIHHGQNGAAQALLDGGASVEGEAGRRALLMAAGYGNPELVRLLLDHGVDPRGTPDILVEAVGGAWDIDYAWPGCAAHTETVRLLLDSAPDLSLGDGFFARRAIKHAERKRCAELLRLVRGRAARPLAAGS